VARARSPRLPSDGRLRELFEGLADAYAGADADGRLVETNAAFRSMVGYTEAELRKMTYRDLTPERWHEMEARILEEQLRQRHYSEVYEKEYRRKDGTVFPVELRTYVILERGRPAGAWAIVRDITERKRVEQALRRSEARFRTLAESVPIGIFEGTPDGRNVYANRAAAEMGGISLAAAAGHGWHESLHPDDRKRVLGASARAVREGRPWEQEYRLRLPDGAVRLVQTRAVPLRDPDGRVSGYIGAMLDVTEQRALEAKIHSSQRMTALGTLLAGLAHEVNNPLSAMLMAHVLLGRQLERAERLVGRDAALDRQELAGLVDRARELLGGAREDAEQIAHVIEELNLLGRPDAPRFRADLGDVVERAIAWLAPGVWDRIAVRVERAEPREVIASKSQLAQVVVNLLTNAAHAIPEGRTGHVVVRVGPGGTGVARLEVEDDGAGMTPEVLGRIFDPFFTTRAVGQGMGLGLSVCHAIVGAHGGSVSARSTPGQGSTFVVELPAAPAG
jgi:PAS domain S-box-containing protein